MHGILTVYLHFGCFELVDVIKHTGSFRLCCVGTLRMALMLFPELLDSQLHQNEGFNDVALKWLNNVENVWFAGVFGYLMINFLEKVSYCSIQDGKEGENKNRTWKIGHFWCLN